LLNVDTTAPPPHGVDVSSVTSHCSTIRHNSGCWLAFGDDNPLEVHPEVAPDSATIRKLSGLIGTASIDGSRVQVPFSVVAPARNQIWFEESTDRLIVPLGRIGAHGIQKIVLGEGTSHHALIGGTTGSGKSNLLHVLVTNAALYYGPSELQLYLIDMKEGVEFKIYSTNPIPHARVVAIESEREFGLSVLAGLVQEVEERGELFRKAGVTTVGSFRRKTGQDLPRILLVIDEFQKLFATEDRIATECKRYLESLARQGRSFGVHIIWGTQTLANVRHAIQGIGQQMSVRIVLPCEPQDSSLFLSDNNRAAESLRIPGEAIYNDNSGSVGSNKKFQVAFLPDSEQEVILNRIVAHADRQGVQRKSRLIVFEGNEFADIATDAAFAEALNCRIPPDSDPESLLGAPVSMREVTSARFRRQSGSNLLVMGQNPDSALGVLVGALITLIRQPNIRLRLVDLSPDSLVRRELLEELPTTVGNGQVVVSRAADLDSEVERGLQQIAQRQSESSLLERDFLVVFGLQRARSLRKVEGSYSPTEEAQRLISVLRDGPDHGFHTICWCDTYDNLQRTPDYTILQYFDLRVAFQMSNEGSIKIVGDASASKLGSRRALFFDRESGHTEKFRPYSAPPLSWIAAISEQLQKPTSSATL